MDKEPTKLNETVSRTTSFEVSAIIDAQLALAAKTDQQGLLQTLLRIVVQKANAQSGYLVLEPDRELFAVADSEIEVSDTPQSDFPGFSSLIVEKVKLSAKPLILTDATGHTADFSNDAHLRKGKAKSIVCLPIKNRNEVIGACYLENRQIDNAFDRELCGMLEILATQAAILLDHIQLDNELRDANASHRLIFENSPVATWEEDFSAVKKLFDRLKADGVTDFEAYLQQHPQVVEQCAEQVRVVDVNRAALALHGASGRDEMLEGLVNTFTPESFKAFRYELIYLWRGQDKMATDAVVKTLAGDPRHVTVEYMVCPGYESSLSKVFVTLVDITEQKRTEQELRDSEAQYRRIFETAQEGIWGQDATFNTTFVNTHMANMLGYAVDEILGRPAADFMFEEDIPDHQNKMENRRNRIAETYERRFIRKDGSVLWTQVSATPVLADDRFQGSFVMVSDITARKQAELQLKQSLAFTEGVINAIPDILIEVDARGTYLNIWTRRPELLAAPKQELIGNTVNDILPAEAAAVCMQAIDEADQRGFSFGNILRLELPEGVHWFELSLSKKPSDEQEVEPHFLVLSRDVTQRMQIEQDLRASEQRLQAILDQTFQFIGLLSTDGRVLQANRAALTFAGIEDSEVIGKPFWETPWWTHSAELQQRLREAVKQAAGGSFLRFEVTHPDRNGALHYVDFSISPVMDDAGHVIQLIPEGRDITEFKETEQVRQQQADRLAYMDRINRAIQGAEDLDAMMHDVLGEVLDIFDCDRAFLMFPCDPNAASWGIPMERTREGCPGLSVQEEGLPMTPHIAGVLELLVNTPGVVKFGPETEHPLDNDIDQRFNIKSLMALALYPRLGKPWQFGLHQCSRERVWSDAEQQLLEAIGQRLNDALSALLVQRDLRESERRLVEAQRLAHFGNWELDLIEDSLTWSDEIFRIFQIDKNRFDASYEAFIETIHPDDRENVDRAYKESLENRQPYDIVHRLLLPGNQIKYVREMCETIYDDDGKPLRSLGTVQDITEQRLKEEELNRYRDHLEEEVRKRTRELQVAKEKAEAANLAKSTFLSSMSHELRTPLNAILGYADLLKQRADDNGPLYDGLSIMHSSGEHLLMLINDILDIAKIETGKLELNPRPFHLPVFLQQIVNIVLTRAEAKHLALSYENLSPLPSVIVADETRLRQVLLNLLGNAVKFTDQGSVVLTVEMLEQTQKEKGLVHLRFRVEDTGIGIAADQMPRIFKPFEQSLKPDKQVDGTGLGLALCQKIILEMGGHLQVSSEIGRGSAFWFEISVPITEAIQEETSSPADIIGYEGPRRKILVADDKPYNRLLLRDLLEPLGFSVRIVEDGQQAIDTTLSWRPDAILMDLVMPVKSGFQAIQEIRQHPQLKDIFIIAISASVSEEMQKKSLDTGGDIFLPKPIEMERLLNQLSRRLALTWVRAEPDIKSSAPMIAPAEAELADLAQLVEEGKVFEIQQFAVDLEAKNSNFQPFARQLHKLARGFDMAAIEDFIHRFKR